jgi:hypothetical protein
MNPHNPSLHEQENEATARRVFLSQIGKAAVTAPAIALLAAASVTPAAAQYSAARPEYDGPPGSPHHHSGSPDHDGAPGRHE